MFLFLISVTLFIIALLQLSCSYSLRQNNHYFNSSSAKTNQVYTLFSFLSRKIASKRCHIHLKNVFSNKGLIPKIPRLLLHNPGISRLKIGSGSRNLGMQSLLLTLPPEFNKGFLQ